MPHIAAGRARFSRDGSTRSVKLLMREGMDAAALLLSASRLGRKRQPATQRAMKFAASFVSARPTTTLADVGRELARIKVMP